MSSNRQKDTEPSSPPFAPAEYYRDSPPLTRATETHSITLTSSPHPAVARDTAQSVSAARGEATQPGLDIFIETLEEHHRAITALTLAVQELQRQAAQQVTEKIEARMTTTSEETLRSLERDVNDLRQYVSEALHRQAVSLEGADDIGKAAITSANRAVGAVKTLMERLDSIERRLPPQTAPTADGGAVVGSVDDARHGRSSEC